MASLKNSKIISNNLKLLKLKRYDEIEKKYEEYVKGGLLYYPVILSYKLAMNKSGSAIKSEVRNKKFTVVTINYNNYKGLKKTVESVINQTDRSLIQYIVMDGNSTDESIDYLKEVSNKIDLPIYGNDEGIYDAMNKALSFANSEYILYLNSGDVFSNNFVVENISNAIKKNESSLIAVYGNTLLSNNSRWIAKPVEEIWKGMICSHQSIFISTDFLKLVGFNKSKKNSFRL